MGVSTRRVCHGLQHAELVESNYAFAQWRDAAKATFAQRHMEDKVARKALESGYSTAALELGDIQERHSEAQGEISRLKRGINKLSSASAVPDVEQDPLTSDFIDRIDTISASRFWQIGITDAHLIILEDFQVQEMHDFLKFLHELPFQTRFGRIAIHQWAAMLKLATFWLFNGTRVV
ncbi:hypothetical protein FRB97_009242 [Tulasnella sp. 331]|nr:hypothetical protein FRB97_009242 [Tulasnella sp. 331]